MTHPLIFSLAGLAALLPAALFAWRSLGQGAASTQMALTLVAFTGSLVAVVMPVLAAGGWISGLSGTLWLSVAASLGVFLLLGKIKPQSLRLGTLLFPYLILLGVLAAIWSSVPGKVSLAQAPESWLVVHILFSVATYALATIAAMAALSVLFKQRALKRKQQSPFYSSLPSVADGDGLLIGLLMAAGAVLGVGVVTGSALQVITTGSLVPFDHKSVLSLSALVVIAVLIWMHQRVGLRGQRASHLVLATYLLLTLAYPGVKFVTDILIG